MSELEDLGRKGLPPCDVLDLLLGDEVPPG